VLHHFAAQIIQDRLGGRGAQKLLCRMRQELEPALTFLKIEAGPPQFDFCFCSSLPAGRGFAPSAETVVCFHSFSHGHLFSSDSPARSAAVDVGA
jgi:hypothetical protein